MCNTHGKIHYCLIQHCPYLWIYTNTVYILLWKYQSVSSYLRANKNMDKDEESTIITTYQYFRTQNRRY